MKLKSIIVLYKESEGLEDKTVQKNLSDFHSTDSNKKKYKSVRRKRKVQKKLSDFNNN